MPRIELGFPLPETEPWRLHRAFFKSKIGGFPAWLNPDNTPSVRCENCKNSMVLLLQIYSPQNQRYSYHRTIYVFMCRDAECHQEFRVEPSLATSNSKSSHEKEKEDDFTKVCLKLPYKVFSTQLSQRNLYYQLQPAKNYDNDKTITKTADEKLASDFCFNCGQKATSRCKNCKMVAYCDKICQTIHWKTMHKNSCKEYVKAINSGKKSKKSSGSSSNFIYPTSQSSWSYKELEIATEREPKLHDSSKGDTVDKINNSLLEKYKTDFDQEEIDNLKINKKLKIDKVFLKFQTRVSRVPDQILRYIPVFDPRLELFVNDQQITTLPPCPSCKGPRILEFQIMPQILNFIRPDENPLMKNTNKTSKSRKAGGKISSADLLGVDFGLLNVYTCQDVCDHSKNLKTTNYLEEHISRHFPSDKNAVFEDSEAADEKSGDEDDDSDDDDTEFEGTDSDSDSEGQRF